MDNFNVIFDINIYISSFITDNLNLDDDYTSITTRAIDKTLDIEKSHIFASNHIIKTFKYALGEMKRYTKDEIDDAVDYLLNVIIDDTIEKVPRKFPALTEDPEDAKIIDLAIYVFETYEEQTYIVTRDTKDFKQVKDKYKSQQIRVLLPHEFLKLIE
jgi:predicted nucleic acid-binding protein